MSRFGLLIFAALIFAVGCGYGSHNYMMGGGGSPQVTQLQPDVATAGGPAFTLTVNGSNFGSDSVVYWSSVPQTTTYVSGTQVTAAITATDIMNVGMVPVYVRTQGRNSNVMNFDVQ